MFPEMYSFGKIEAESFFFLDASDFFPSWEELQNPF
jgi:hypothetical protein